ncbi:tetratricopeptide repeat protein [Winogradskya humida]|uniref:Tetratricopeptide repeat protein n=1 Tax=Winogradskya humida TaxID=113566 RepID=A0ABQ3ZEQ2_9ACTN|nr:tetratricopeptide repeat protein [Actinoplanes humidus]GIE16994.1 hypothetical protein Ahu01nite_000960 [Actinoplanes humidus]
MQPQLRDPAAASLAMLLSQFAPAPIPADLLEPAPLAVLAEAGMVVSVGDGGLVRVPESVSASLRAHPVAEPGRRIFARRPHNWPEAAAGFLTSVLPSAVQDPATWDLWELLLPHAEAVLQKTNQASRTTGALRYRCGTYLRERGQLLDAARHLSQASGEATRDIDAANAMSAYAIVLQELGELQEARTLYERSLATTRKVRGELDPATLSVMNNLAAVLNELGDFPAARQLLTFTVERFRRALGPDNPGTLSAMTNLAAALYGAGDRPAARKLLEESLAGHRRVLGDDDPQTLSSAFNLAVMLHHLGEPAADLYAWTLAGRRRVLGDHHPATQLTERHLASLTQH